MQLGLINRYRGEDFLVLLSNFCHSLEQTLRRHASPFVSRPLAPVLAVAASFFRRNPLELYPALAFLQIDAVGIFGNLLKGFHGLREAWEQGNLPISGMKST